MQGSGTKRGGSGGDAAVFAWNDDFEPSDCFCTPIADGGSGNDHRVEVRGSGGIADGGSGHDGNLAGGNGAAELRGGSAADVLTALADDLTLNGGSGVDTCDPLGHTGVIFISCEVIP